MHFASASPCCLWSLGKQRNGENSEGCYSWSADAALLMEQTGVELYGVSLKAWQWNSFLKEQAGTVAEGLNVSWRQTAQGWESTAVRNG